jgi:hypothetical protein
MDPRGHIGDLQKYTSFVSIVLKWGHEVITTETSFIEAFESIKYAHNLKNKL